MSAAVLVALACILFTSAAVTVAHAQTYTVLYNFGGVSGDPLYPYFGPIAQGRDGNLYAATPVGGSQNKGTVFVITTSGTLTVLSSLGGEAGNNPNGGLTLGLDGNFYGTTAFGGGRRGRGTVFQITPEGKLTVLHAFSSDQLNIYPYAPPILGADGNLYGTTAGNGVLNSGTVYKLVFPRHFATLHQFTGGAEGGSPQDALLQASDGKLYGTTGAGTAFKISLSGVFTNLGSLSGYSIAPFIQSSNGILYGATMLGGSFGDGTVFQMTGSGKTRILHEFDTSSDLGAGPIGLVPASDGNFYGATSSGGALGGGSIYTISPAGDFNVIYSFDLDTGASPLATLVQHTNGLLYGEAAGGLYDAGVFYSLDIGAPPFVRLVSNFGRAGQAIGILGQGFTGATEVSFNGIPATFTVSSDTYMEATVPTGATTGFVTVTTSTGTLTSNQKIKIRQ